jgi:hypothetical protein
VFIETEEMDMKNGILALLEVSVNVAFFLVVWTAGYFAISGILSFLVG